MGHADEHHACRDEDSILSFDDLLQFYHKRLLEAAVSIMPNGLAVAFAEILRC